MDERFFWWKRKCHWRREIRSASNKQNWRKHCKNSSNYVWKSSAVRSIAEQMNIDRETVSKILTEDLDMRKVCANWFQKSSAKNKSKEESQFAKTFWRGKMTFRAASSQVMKHRSTNTTLKRSGKMQNGRLPIPTTKWFRRSKSRVKTMLLTFFFYIRGIVHYEFEPSGQKVNQVYYLDVLERLREKDGNDPKFLPTTHGSCNTTMHLLTRHCLWGSF